MASIIRMESPFTGRVSHRAQVRVTGFPSQSATFPTRVDARQWALSAEAAIRESRYFPYRRAQRITFAQLLRRYREQVVPEWPPQRLKSREAHFAWWLKRFGALSLAAITPELIIEARDDLVGEGWGRGKSRTAAQSSTIRHRKGSTANRYLSTLSHMFTIAAKEWQWVERNYVYDIRKRNEIRGRIRFLSSDERDRLLQACAQSKWPLLHTLVLLALSTGARRGELINLTWGDIHLSAACPQISLSTSKNGDPRVLPILGQASTQLRDLDRENNGRNKHLFPRSPQHDEPYASFDPIWRLALNEAHVSNFHFHDLRHTCASYLAMQGASFVEIAAVLGHRDLRTSQRYSHLAIEHKSTVVGKMVQEHGL